NVAGAYHSRFMKTAQDKLVSELQAVEMQMPPVPVYCNYEARPVTSTDDIRAMLGEQVCGSVRWAASMEQLIEQGERLFIEMGPGSSLAGMMSRICKEATVISIEDVPSLLAAVEKLKAMQ
ncbi:MAG: [acyl-carrier-protein] S-malonyltransferase, partial [Akkermansia sp.]